MENAIQLIFQIGILIFSVVLHEVCHGYAALALGDKTAQYAGRLTLNPIKHVDPMGSIILPLFLSFLGGPIFGWAKPVPYNPYNLKNQKWGPAMVGVAGPAANVALALFFGILIRVLPVFAFGSAGLFIFHFMGIARIIVLINLMLALFNLIPIPPLDGSKVLFALLPYRWYGVQSFLERYGFFIVIFFIFSFSQWLTPAVVFLFRLFTGTFFF